MRKRNEIITKTEMVATVNAVTKELETRKVTMIVEKDVPKFKNEPFTIVFQAVNSLLVRDMPLADCKVLLYLISKVQYGNIIDRTIKEIAEDLGYKDIQWIQKSIKRLEDRNVILKSKHPYDKRRYVYMINPKHSWKGTVKDRNKTIGFFNPQQIEINFEHPETEIKPTKRGLPINTDFLNM
jgi:predicted transcriptional regulator